MTLIVAPAFAQEAKTDTVQSTKEVKNRNVLLNASSANQPRQINIGLPAEMSATIYEDGTPLSWTWWPLLPYYYWSPGPGYGRMGSTTLSEATVTTGTVANILECWSAPGSEQFRGSVGYKTNIRGRQNLSVGLSGPIAKGWSYAVAAHIDHDPGDNKVADAALQQKQHQYFAGITKRFKNGKGDMSLFYKYAQNQMLSDGSGPFYYEGDGSVETLAGFDLGRDGYLPANGLMEYTDVRTGKKVAVYRNGTNKAMSNDLKFVLNYNFSPRLSLKVMSKYHYANVNTAQPQAIAMNEAVAGTGNPYTYAYSEGGHKAGDPYVGKVQMRWMSGNDANERAWYNTAELNGRSKNNHHSWRTGVNFWWVLPEDYNSTALFLHTVEKNPVWLNFMGQRSMSDNGGASYVDGHEVIAAAYASDDWQVTDRLWLSGGLRLQYYKSAGHNAPWLEYDMKTVVDAANERTNGWSMLQAKKTPFSIDFFLPSVSLTARYTLLPGFGVEAEGIFSRAGSGCPGFEGQSMPNTDPSDTYFGKGGIFWNNSWIKLVSQVSYIKKTNYQRGMQFTNPNDASDVVSMNTTYDVETVGWTTDAVITPFKGFMFHGLLTLQSPKYKNYKFTVPFKNAPAVEYSFDGNCSGGVSKTIIELDPSYMFGPFRAWASFRYQSKQYINKTNSLYFNGRWETFAGIDYNLNKNVSFSVNFVNLFNQKGASGSISSADLVTETAPYKHYLMAGSYIRPFTVEFGTNIHF